MTLDNDKAREIYKAVRNLPIAERESFLNKECGDDDALLDEVKVLLKHDDFNSAYTLESTDPFGSTVDYEPDDTMEIGRFKIIGTLGEGGMGIVYLADQREPVKRRVALKVIKAGMDTKQVVARFEAERQALAMMNHPGIAKVFEAGETKEGRPFFVLEYVKGMPITEACDEHKLNTNQRLELLAKVCDAVQHAHMKGIIHRDLKPNNILVSLGEDDILEPKIIDFGVAKAINQQLTDKTLVTQVGHFIGTPAYMSPEQADLKAMDIDTRSDVYALGVITYEVLSGIPPFDPRTFRTGGLEKMREIIRTQPPPKPSTQLSNIDDYGATKIADAHQIQIHALAGLLRKELEWIPLKALRKRRSERYDSAKCMGDDIRRYLRGEALEAGPETMGYRLKKSIMKYRVQFVAAALLSIVLVAGIISTSLFAISAEQQRKIALEKKIEAQEQRLIAEEKTQEADYQTRIAIEEKERAEAVKEFVIKMLSSVNPATAGKMDKELIKLVLSQASQSVSEGFKEQPIVEAEIRGVIFVTYFSLGLLKEAHPHAIEQLSILRRVLGDEHPDTINSILNMGAFLASQGRLDEANLYYKEALVKSRRILGNEHINTILAITHYGVLLKNQAKYDEAFPYYKEALETSRRVLGDTHQDTLGSIHNMGSLFSIQGKYDEAMQCFKEVLEINRQVLGDEHPTTLNTIQSIGILLHRQGKYDEALPYYKEALETKRQVLGDEHPSTLGLINNMGALLKNLRRYDEAFAYSNEALETSRRVLGDAHPSTANAMNNMGALLKKQGKYDEALPYYKEALNSNRQVFGDENAKTLLSIERIGYLFYVQEKYEEAENYFLEVHHTNIGKLGKDDPVVVKEYEFLVKFYEDWGKVDKAKIYRDKFLAHDTGDE